MAITTVDGLVAGMLPPVCGYKAAVTAEAAGVLYSTFYTSGLPGAATAPAPGMAGAALTSYVGQIEFPAAVGSENIYVARLSATCAAGVGMVRLCDRLWHNSGIVVTTTTAQTINSVAWPARSRDGTVNGDGVMVAVEVRTATTNGSAITNMTMSYTSQDGTSGRTATIGSFPATAAVGTLVPFLLAAGDTGVRSIQTVTLGTSLVAGAVHLVAYRCVASVGTPLASAGYAANAIDLGFPRMFDGSVPWVVLMPTATGVGVVAFDLTYAQG
jgi:hypothetical protein